MMKLKGKKLNPRTRKDQKRIKRWGIQIREKSEGKCEYCGREGCDSAHIISRKFLKTRYLKQNGIYLCRECHIKFDNNIEFRELLIKVLITLEIYEKLKRIRDGEDRTEEYGFEIID